MEEEITDMGSLCDVTASPISNRRQRQQQRQEQRPASQGSSKKVNSSFNTRLAQRDRRRKRRYTFQLNATATTPTKSRRWAVLLLLLLVNVTARNVNQDNTRERAVLIDFFDATSGGNSDGMNSQWKKGHDTWRSPTVSICDWFGITCDDDADSKSNDDYVVTAIRLSDNHLQGEIPSSLWTLPALKEVEVAVNLLTELHLEGLGGDGSTVMTTSSPLQTLDVGGNQLTTLNGIEHAQDTLRFLTLTRNVFQSTLPTTLYSLTNLQSLSMAFNEWSGTLSTQIGTLTNLVELYAFSNRLTGTLPTELGKLASAQLIGLGNNDWHGTLPTELNQLVNLRDLSIHNQLSQQTQADDSKDDDPPTGLTGPLLSFGELPFLSLLYLDGNRLTGTIPNDFLRHTNETNNALMMVGLSHNQLEGSVPKTLERFDLLTIDLTGNRITDVPEVLCKKPGWMGGLVEEYGCSAILCPKGTFNSRGRVSSLVPICQKCLDHKNGDDKQSFLGTVECAKPGGEVLPLQLLSNFYTSMAGEKWTIRTGWEVFAVVAAGATTIAELQGMGTNPCSSNNNTDPWHGIECDANGEITSINLPQNELFGTVPDTIFTLPHLTSFNIANNNVELQSFHGPSLATQLNKIILSNVKVQSWDDLANLQALEELSLDGLAAHTALPDDLFRLTNLKKLHLEHGSFQDAMPTQIGALSNLEVWKMYDNAFSGSIPTQIGLLTNLQVIDLSLNKIEGSLPTEIEKLTVLSNFLLHQVDGGLSGKLPAFNKLPKLIELNLESNSFTGAIPADFFGGVTNKAHPTRIWLGSNQLTGSVPESLVVFSNLDLKLEGNQITGLAPTLCNNDAWMSGEVGKATEGTKCDAILCPPLSWATSGRQRGAAICEECPSNTNMYGQTSCGTLVKTREQEILDKLFLETGGAYWKLPHDNWMKPGVPICKREGVNCFQDDANEGVREIRLNSFGLRGTVPSEIWELTKARELSFTGNEVDVSFQGVEKATGLIVLKFSKCHLRGLEGLGKASATLKELHVAQNQFNGTIPDEIFDLDKIKLIFLNSNHFSGKIPTLLGQMTSLQSIQLWNNQLTGPIPSEIGTLRDLTTLNVAQNDLSGVLPAQMDSLDGLLFLDLSNQQGAKLQGKFPAFDKHPDLVSIDASGNAFSGPLPPAFLSQTNSESQIKVNFTGNHFEGEIPETWARFGSLEIDLAANLITSIPSTLCTRNEWNKGLVGLLGKCDAILCPVGTSSPAGRQTDPMSPCEVCVGGEESAAYFGSQVCLDPDAVREREILTKFYLATNGTNWLTQTNWARSASACSWFGVTCNADGFVEELYLETNFLKSPKSGRSEASIVFSLPHLRILDLKGNQISLDFLQIPSTSALEFIRLSGNELTSLNGISRASRLKALHVTNNELTNIPLEVYGMRELESLFLSFNYLRGTISSHIGSMSSLKELYIFGNELTGTIPTNVGALSLLAELVLAQNYLSGTIPSELSRMPALQQLSIYGQSGPELITGPLPTFSGSPNVWYLDASGNDLTGTIPGNFLENSAYTEQPVTVFLENNEISGAVPSNLARFGHLNLRLSGNKIVDLPENLCRLDGWMDDMVGTIGNCSAILCPKGTFNQFGRHEQGEPCVPCHHLDGGNVLGNNHCESFTSERDTLVTLYQATGGEFWSSGKSWMSEDPICSWEGVTCGGGDRQDNRGVSQIELPANGLEGTLPSVVWTLPSLRHLNVKTNPMLDVNFDGIENAADSLEVLYLSQVKMESIDGVSRATSLRELHLTNNKLTGTFPVELLSLADTLESLYISSNLFFGTLPTALGTMTKLRSLFSFDNDFLSTIPTEIGQLRDLSNLILAENLLFGQLPSELSTMPNLQILAVFREEKSGPRLSGTLPAFNLAPQLTDIYLQGNDIHGSVPVDFATASKALQTVRLGENLLTGTVPLSFANIPKLTFEAHDNYIEGFPRSLCDQGPWMDGAMESYGCQAFLCPPGKASPMGRQTNSTTECLTCSQAGAAPYYGSTRCTGPPSEREILVNLFYATQGQRWYRKDFWGSTADVCDWYGVACHAGHVVEINLRGNNLQGSPGTDLFYLRHLQVLWLYSNPISFRFDNIEEARKLRDLRLDMTNTMGLTGISKASSLVSFDASFTEMNGAIPWDELGSLKNLRRLSLASNALTGSIPESFGLMNRLTYLRLDSNRLSGSVPSFDELRFLKHIDLSNNLFNGPISKTFLDSINPKTSPTIRLAHNQLTGVIPEEFDRFESLKLHAAGNKILGLPLSLCDNGKWNGNDVSEYGCDAILCRPGFYSVHGRRSQYSPCKACSSAAYYGETICLTSSSSALLTPGFVWWWWATSVVALTLLLS